MHRTVPGAAGAGQSTSGSLAMVNGGDKMSEKLAALEDLNELLEEPVEEQVSVIILCSRPERSVFPDYLGSH